MPASAHILLIEDDPEIGALISPILHQHGFRVTIATDGKGADIALAHFPIDLVLLDLMLPDEDGFAICRRLRAESTLPIIIVTALGDEMDRIIGLEMGADDYVLKPFSPRELVARVKAVLRRLGPAQLGQERPAALLFEGWRVDLGLRQVRAPDSTRVLLTSLEFDLLVAFCENPRRVLSRETLLELTHGKAELDRSVDIMISRLRKKIEVEPHNPGFIKTVRSGGYLLAADVTAERAAHHGMALHP